MLKIIDTDNGKHIIGIIDFFDDGAIWFTLTQNKPKKIIKKDLRIIIKCIQTIRSNKILSELSPLLSMENILDDEINHWNIYENKFKIIMKNNKYIKSKKISFINGNLYIISKFLECFLPFNKSDIITNDYFRFYNYFWKKYLNWLNIEPIASITDTIYYQIYSNIKEHITDKVGILHYNENDETIKNIPIKIIRTYNI